MAAPLEFLPLDQLRQQLEINLIGQAAVTQAFLPALRRARGRIVNVSSIGGRVALPLVERLQRVEVRPRGDERLAAARAAPAGRRRDPDRAGRGEDADLGEERRLADEMLEDVPPEAERLYGKLIEAVRARHAQDRDRDGERAERGGRGDRDGATASRPRTRYLVGSDAKLRARMSKVLPDRVMDRMIARALRG